MTDMLYTVTWSIDLPADSPEDAARQALEAMRDGTARSFLVGDENGCTTDVDLADG